MSTESERPVPPRPRTHDDLWHAFETISNDHAKLVARVDDMDPRLKKVEESEIETSKNVASAIERQTVALVSLAKSLTSARNVGGWILVLLALMFAATVLMAIVVASPLFG